MATISIGHCDFAMQFVNAMIEWVMRDGGSNPARRQVLDDFMVADDTKCCFPDTFGFEKGTAGFRHVNDN